MAEGPAVAEVEATYGDQVEFVGIGGKAAADGYANFIERTGTTEFTQLRDNEAGELWERFGTGGRSTFLFIQEDGSYVLTSYGVVDKSELTTQVERLIES